MGALQCHVLIVLIVCEQVFCLFWVFLFCFVFGLHCGVNCAARRRSTLPLVADLDRFSRLDMVTSSSDHSPVRPSKHVGSTGLMDAASTASVVGQKWTGMSWSWVCHGMLGEVSMVWTRVSILGNSSSAHSGQPFPWTSSVPVLDSCL